MQDTADAAARDLASACKAGLGHGLLLTLRYLVGLMPRTWQAQPCSSASPDPSLDSSSVANDSVPDGAEALQHGAMRRRVARMLGLAQAMTALALPPLGHGCAGFSGDIATCTPAFPCTD